MGQERPKTPSPLVLDRAMYAPAADVANALCVADPAGVQGADLIGALVNALNRVAALETRLARAEFLLRARAESSPPPQSSGGGMRHGR
jgi:hypothetical protein